MTGANNGGSVDNLFCIVSMALILWGISALLENQYGIKGQHYGALLLGSEISAWFPYRSLVLGI